MGQKIHPLGFRLGITKKHKSIWFAKTKIYSDLIIEDNILRKFIIEKYLDAGISKINIQRKLNQITIEIFLARPNIIIGREGIGLENLKTILELKLKKINQNNSKIAIQINELSNPDTDASFITEFLSEQLEKRVPFRRAVRQAIQKAQRSRVQGIKIKISGRLNGNEIARSEWVREGRVPLHTLRADIDYSYRIAKTIYGLLGIKAWVFKGENFIN
uniref:Small ribosomal subunit protein uS3c n=1 Tax=Koliella corcontica TaxID=155904 RepID=A0A097KMW0_9CHLO|nr:ribosomal protein S3 [Koliella corcontica]AIT94526.1 ribosomal protein S3 [Koliella corcontica]